MTHFLKTEVSASGKATVLYIILEAVNDELPEITEELLKKNKQFESFVAKKKSYEVAYTIYKTEEKPTNATQPEVFEVFIDEKKAEIISSGELIITPKSSKKKKNKTSPVVLIISILLTAGVCTFGGLAIGKKLFGNYEVPTEVIKDEITDGLIIPQQDEINADAAQITVAIDRSYSAVPTEDLQLKGEIVNGKADITLPEFDKTDFFSHVEGYTWGFSTVPDAEKIEYYGGQTYSFTEDTKLYRVLVKYGGGSGTKDDPYLIDYYDQLELMSKEKARGYFKQTADIIFPAWATHTPIDTVNELKENPSDEYFSYDGNGYCIDNLTQPLFGTVSGALIENVNIRNGAIVSYDYQNFGAIVCDARNYQYVTEDGASYETGETIIRHCSVSHTYIKPTIYLAEGETLPPETVEIPAEEITYDEEGNVIEPTTNTTEVYIPKPTKTAENAIGAITGVGGQIESCYVTDFGIYAEQSDYYLFAGGISGKPASVTDSAVYYYSAQGKIFYAGGIAGSAGGCRQYNAIGKELPTTYGGTIQGCLARNVILTSELASGGIAGSGSTDAEYSIISNCYANELQLTSGEFDTDGNLVTAGICGGVIGADNTGANGHLISNTVSVSDYSVIGQRVRSTFDDTVRHAPAFAFYQENILSVINANTVDQKNPKEIFTGSFTFSKNGEFGDNTGSLAYPSAIADLFAKTIVETTN